MARIRSPCGTPEPKPPLIRPATKSPCHDLTDETSHMGAGRYTRDSFIAKERNPFIEYRRSHQTAWSV